MRIGKSTLLSLVMIAGVASPAFSGQTDEAARAAAMLEALDQAGSHFERNLGQLDEATDFAFRAPDYRLDLCRSGIELGLNGPDRLLGGPMRITFLHCSGSAEPTGRNELPFSVMHRTTRDGVKRGLSRIPAYANVEYKDMYKGIDVQYHVRGGQVEYDFVVAPKADPRQIELGLEGTDRALLDPEGNLRLLFPVAELVHHKPYAYQVIEGRRVPVEGRYELQDENQVAIVVGAYDANHPLIIDPLISVTMKPMQTSQHSP